MNSYIYKLSHSYEIFQVGTKFKPLTVSCAKEASKDLSHPKFVAVFDWSVINRKKLRLAILIISHTVKEEEKVNTDSGCPTWSNCNKNI